MNTQERARELAGERKPYVYYDEDSDPSNPGWVLAHWHQDPRHWGPLTEALDATSEEGALAEAADYLGVGADAIEAL